MKRILGSLALLLLLQPVLSHYKARYHVIVDTDGGIDDLRAICLMLASPQIEIIAITAVNGVLEAEATVRRVRSLLEDFGHQGIPVGAGDLIPASIELEDMPVDFVALGPLTNLAGVLRQKPATPGLIRDVYWHGGEENRDSFNYFFDSRSAQEVLASGFSLCRVHAEGNTQGVQDAFLQSLDSLPSRYAAALGKFYRNAPPDFSGAECVPLFLLHPEDFSVTGIKQDPERRLAAVLSSVSLAETMLAVLDSDREDKSIVFDRFPVDPALFEKDVAELIPQLIERHGLKEWKIVVMTNEFHEHLGIYSIIGAKMGLRAREYFHVGIDELRIVSYAGSQPPVSCLNDGLQASTGGTLGHGTISLGEGQSLPKALFYFKNRAIEVTVKEEVREKIREEVSRGVQEYGLESQGYWDYIRELALKDWLELSRFEIFEITPLPPVP